MNDTSKQMQNIYSRLIMEKTGIERLKMGASMFATSRKIMESSLDKHLSPTEKKIIILKRLYGNDFSEDEMTRIVEHFKTLK